MAQKKPVKINIEYYISQIKAFIKSPLVEQYLIGITANVKSRRRSYISERFEYFLVLDVGMDKNQALEIERDLFDALIKDKKNITYSKYHLEKRDKPYRKSSGGKTGGAYAVYIAA